VPDANGPVQTDADFVVTDWREFAHQVAVFSEQQF
jgi:hypothetical protein